VPEVKILDSDHNHAFLNFNETRSIPRALLRESRINGLYSMMMWTILIYLAGVDTTVVICAIGF